jgi:hypothetical protein
MDPALVNSGGGGGKSTWWKWNPSAEDGATRLQRWASGVHRTRRMNQVEGSA